MGHPESFKWPPAYFHLKILINQLHFFRAPLPTFLLCQMNFVYLKFFNMRANISTCLNTFWLHAEDSEEAIRAGRLVGWNITLTLQTVLYVSDFQWLTSSTGFVFPDYFISTSRFLFPWEFSANLQVLCEKSFLCSTRQPISRHFSFQKITTGYLMWFPPEHCFVCSTLVEIMGNCWTIS